MGAVDLVIQVESPKSVARGLQRIGRAGHSLGEVSKGRIFPKFRADLLESAVVAQRMREGAIEETQIPRNPLDVLAQQIVGICADTEIEVDALHELVRGAYPFADLSRAQLENVLDMLAGRYPSDEFAELRPRIVWDRTGGVVRGRQGARRLAVTNAGTIPDRGLFGVFIVDGGGRVGELDEEMVYESRAGQVIMLGASSWRIEEITRDRVLVSPAPGVPGSVPFWKGEGIGRPYELGEAIGRFSRELTSLPEQKASARLVDEVGLDAFAARNLLTFLQEQQRATGVVPSDRAVVVERFRDEIGDWRICILTPFGARVHAPWAMAVGARLRDSLGVEVQSIWSDDGIAFHLPDADSPPATDLLMLDPDELDDLVVGEVGQTALFGARFRENAARALLIPRRRPGERTPLWQQRLKAQGLLQVARKYPSFPIVLETYRECLQDVFDLPALKRLLRGLRTREIDLVDVETASASPFASSLLFDYIATYMYEDDTPPAERRAQALSLDRDLLRELLGQEELRELIDRDALAEVEASLRPSAPDPDRLHDLLRLRGDLRTGEFDEAHAAILEAERRAIRIRIGGEERLIAAEDAGRYRDALGVMPPSGLPEVFLEGGPDSLRQLVQRYARGRGPFTTAQAHAWFGVDVEPLLRAAGTTGEARPRRAASRRNGARVVRSRGAAAAAARVARRAAPRGRAGGAGGARPLPAALARRRPARVAARGADPAAGARAAGVAVGVGGAAAPRARVPARAARPALRVRRARLGRSGTRPRRGVLPRGRAGARPPGRRAAAGRGAARGHPRGARERRAVLVRPARRDAARGRDRAAGAVGSRLGRRGDERPVGAAARGAPLPAAAPGPARASLLPRTRGAGDGDAGPLVARGAAVRRRAGPARARGAAARAPGHRHARLGARRGDSVRGEGIAGGYGAVYSELRALETLGTCRRGYFVEGLGGAQFALAGAVERLRELRPREGDEPEPLVLAAADPAQPYGAALPWPKRAGARAARVAGAHVVLLGGEAALYVERGGRSLVPLREPDPDWLRPALAALVAHVKRGGAKRLAVERFDGEPVTETLAMQLLVEAGFLAGPRRAVLRA